MTTIKIIRTNSENQHFRALVKQLDLDLAIRDGDEHAFFAQFNKIDQLNQVVIAYENDLAMGCGAIKEFNSNTMEVKRMFVLPVKRGLGIASQILNELEHWTKELNYIHCILETGFKQPEAIALYKKNCYKTIPNYGQYKNVKSSICFKKTV